MSVLSFTPFVEEAVCTLAMSLANWNRTDKTQTAADKVRTVETRLAEESQ